MANYVLSCCSTADLTEEHLAQRDIHYICFHYMLDGVSYPDDLGKSMPFDKFYDAMAHGAHAGNLIKSIAGKVGGGGGGRPNMAQAGGKNPAGIPDAIAEAKTALEAQLA